jgi:membrane associated rhomboid family serine protease
MTGITAWDLMRLCGVSSLWWQENPMLGPPGRVLDQLGAKDTPRIAYSYQLWRLITPIFLHAGFVHLLTNLIMQLRLAVFLVRVRVRVSTRVITHGPNCRL